MASQARCDALELFAPRNLCQQGTWPEHLVDLGCPFGRHLVDLGCPYFLPAAGSVGGGKFQLLEEIVGSILATIWLFLLVDLAMLMSNTAAGFQ